MNIILVLGIMWTLKSAFLLILIGYECESAHMALKNAQARCVLIHLEGNQSEFARAACQQLRREGSRARRAVSACGLFTVNARLPLRILSVVATYTIVLLQFNFL
ncbi:uncharacterized protein [Battus philenor]|uniref:uncharacterized protein n=1 Tax=Battus philenor TaxID=42288 RepID=UPI0035CF2237